MKIVYLLENTSLCGGVKVVCEHARMLSENGFSVTIVAKGAPPAWFHLGDTAFITVREKFTEVSDLLNGFDLVIATFYQQVLELHDIPLRLVHFTQGYEADYPFWYEKKADIDKAYRFRVPKITISQSVVARIKEKFSQTPYYVPQGIDLSLFSPKESAHTPKKVIIVGTWENRIKGIADAVKGFLIAKKSIPELALVRVSTLPLSEEEKAICIPDEYHTAVSPADMAGIYRSADIAVIPSYEGEGFGLPAIEAMACGLPAILTRIHSFLSFDSVKDYAYFVSPGSSHEISEALIQICQRPELAAILRRRGRLVAEGFSLEMTKEHLLRTIETLSRHDFSQPRDINYIYIERAEKENATEERLLSELSRETFCPGSSFRILRSEDPSKVSLGDIRAGTDVPYIAISLDDTVFFSDAWERPLSEALNRGFDLASPVSPELFEVVMPYFTPLTFNDVAVQMEEKYRGQYRHDLSAMPYVFLVKKSCLDVLPDNTLLRDLPKLVKSTFVPSSLVHRFGDFYTSTREDILSYIPFGTKRILDVGCAKGMVGKALKERLNCEVYGIELNEQMAGEARTRLDEVYCTDIENSDLPFRESLDVIVFGDILEHLINPSAALTNSRKWLKRDGIVIASIPNTGHYSFITDLIRGRWDYVPVGLLCITHLRFFTRRSIEELFRKSGYSVISISPQGWPMHLRTKITEMLSKYINIQNIDEDIFTPGFYVVARPATDPGA